MRIKPTVTLASHRAYILRPAVLRANPDIVNR